MDKDRKKELIKLSRFWGSRGTPSGPWGRVRQPDPGSSGVRQRRDPDEIVEEHREETRERSLSPYDQHLENKRLRQLRRETRDAERATFKTEEVVSERYQDAPIGLRRRQRIQLDPSGEMGGEYGRWRSVFASKYSSDNPEQADEFILDFQNVMSGIERHLSISTMEKAWAFMAVMENKRNLMEEAASTLGRNSVQRKLNIFHRTNVEIMDSFRERAERTGIREPEITSDIRRKQSRAGKGLKHWRNFFRL